MPPSGEKMWHTNYMEEYNKRRPPRKTYNYRKPILKKTTPKATEIHVPTTYITEPQVYNTKILKEPKLEDFLGPRPHTSQGFYQDDSATSKTFNEYFANLSLRGPDELAVKDGHPSTNVPMFLDSYFPMSLSDIPSQEYYMWCLLNAANAAQQKTQVIPKPPAGSRPQTARQRPKTPRPTTAKSRPQTSDSRTKTACERPLIANDNPGTLTDEANIADIASDPINTTNADILNLDPKENVNENLQSYPEPALGPLPQENTTQSQPKTQEYHWLCWPEPEPRPPSPSRRPNTVLGIHKELPRYGNSGPDIEDRTDSPEPSYVFGVREESTRGPPMTFVPDLQSWINAASDYEKAVIYKMMQTMNGSLPMPPPPSLRPRRETTYTFGSNRVNSHLVPNPMNPYAQAWQPRLQPNSVPASPAMDGLHQLPSLPQMYRSNTDLRPASRNVMRYPMSDDYTHEHSMFMTTQPLCRGHFIIHPDWVSERVRRKPAMPFKKNRGQGMRYGTK